MSEKQWYALYTRSRAEKKVLIELQEMGVQAYLPLINTLRQWSDRKKKVEVPLIPGYIFVKTELKQIPGVLSIDAAIKIIAFEGKYVSIPENQIKAIQTLIEKGYNISASDRKIEKGDSVKIASGALKGLKGEVLESSGGRKFILRIEIGYTLIINLKNTEVIKV